MLTTQWSTRSRTALMLYNLSSTGFLKTLAKPQTSFLGTAWYQEAANSLALVSELSQG